MTEWWIDIQNGKNRKCVEPIYRLWIGRRVNGGSRVCPCLAHPLGTTLSALGLSLFWGNFNFFRTSIFSIPKPYRQNVNTNTQKTSASMQQICEILQLKSNRGSQ